MSALPSIASITLPLPCLVECFYFTSCYGSPSVFLPAKHRMSQDRVNIWTQNSDWDVVKTLSAQEDLCGSDTKYSTMFFIPRKRKYSDVMSGFGSWVQHFPKCCCVTKVKYETCMYYTGLQIDSFWATGQKWSSAVKCHVTAGCCDFCFVLDRGHADVLAKVDALFLSWVTCDGRQSVNFHFPDVMTPVNIVM